MTEFMEVGTGEASDAASAGALDAPAQPRGPSRISAMFSTAKRSASCWRSSASSTATPERVQNLGRRWSGVYSSVFGSAACSRACSVAMAGS